MSETIGEAADRAQVIAKRWLKLVEEPEWGLLTWNQMLAHCSRELRDVLDEMLGDGPPADQSKEDALGERVLEMRAWLVGLMPTSREQSLALTKLDECELWAQKGLELHCGGKR